MAAALRDRGHDVTCSHEVSPEVREYERTVTTVVNAALRPRCRAYLRGIADVADEVHVMTSAGGLLPVADAAELPAALLLSGPAGGVRAAAAVAVANGFPDAITFDMGGTSTDVCLVLDGAPAPAAERSVGGYTVRFPSLDIHTIGAGGGSIAQPRPGRRAARRAAQRRAPIPGPPATAAAAPSRPSPTPTSSPAASPPSAAFGGLALDRAAPPQALAQAGVTADGVIQRGRRLDGAGPAGGLGRAGRRPAVAGAGGLRRRRAAARLRAGRRARHGGGDRAGAGRGAVGGRAC